MSKTLQWTLTVMCATFAIVGLTTGDQTVAGVGGGLGIALIGLVVERLIQRGPRARTSVQLCNQNPLGDHGHGCIRRADDGHTMHLCAHGDCSWGY